MPVRPAALLHQNRKSPVNGFADSGKNIFPAAVTRYPPVSEPGIAEKKI